MDDRRQARKNEHLQLAMEIPPGPLSPGWDDVRLVHQALLKDSMDAIDTSTDFLGKKLQLPLIINAMTGGAQGLERINESLARVAAENGLGMAVGSQAAALVDPAVRHTFEIVREVNTDGLVLANVSALAEPRQALEAVEMIEADALQLHLNGLQELLMKEGDRNFSRQKENIAQLVEISPVPVIVKEVGWGLSRETARELYHLGVRIVDVGGAGGTNFAAIENARNTRGEPDYFHTWGLNTVISLLEVTSLDLPLTIIASGGVTNPLEICKALSLGAHTVGMAGSLLKILLQDGEEALNRHIRRLGEELKIVMMLTGAAKVSQLPDRPLVICGQSKEWCEQRGINTAVLARKCGKNGGGC